MYCPSCGKEIPTDSTFCLHCGSAVSTSVTTQPIEWEYRDFVYTWSPKATWMQLSNPESLVAARLFFWQECQSYIMAELQKWQDEGWEPIGEIGPSAIKTREYKSLYQGSGALGGCLITLLAICTLGLFVPFMFTSYAEPTEFRVAMRRRLPQTE